MIERVIEHPAAQKLLGAFRQFGKVDWHGRMVAGYRPNEIHTLLMINKCVGEDSPGMAISEISKLLRVSSPTITQTIKQLESEGLVTRSADPADLRVVLIRLTETGKQVAMQAIETYTMILTGLVEYLGEEQSNQLAELLTKTNEYFSKEQPIKKDSI